jgi:hypothetical protein
MQHRNRFLQGFDQILTLDRRLARAEFVAVAAMFWLVVLIWYLGLFGLFKQSSTC